ncbi:alkaline ceramidase [Paenibacillus sp. J31TS4]|uniref:neutral/alkaline non-lysosomal ceramidase N-terminal domain-containing protein n=1 Tax=Paenibacillus sp. J31TS4 TaxID=2807195 RepID=UPI001B26268E|nr:neutral/alkaline non-lysosomal ceramidase N-terminal domain-containing protein [Paenibacillus sp. J31TS4]GIP36996.1 alkaline ceramidase [Paenibacillus sp. J31TS4]
MTRKLHLGVRKVDITPMEPVPLAGFAVRSGQGPFTGVSERLFARLFVFDSQALDDDGAAKRALLVSADLIWWGSERVPRLKARISERYGIEPDAILLHGTHTHSGPQTSALFTSYLGVPDEAYLDSLETNVVNGIAEAIHDLEPVHTAKGTGKSELAINRRGLRRTPPELRTADQEVSVLRYTREDGSVKAILAHYACHPVITDENRVSPDYVGIAMSEVEGHFGKGTVCGFLQGTCGDLNPGDGKAVLQGRHDLVVQAGRSFAQAILRTLEEPMAELPAVGLSWRTVTVPLPLASLPEPDVLASGEALPGVQGEWHRIQRSRYAQLKPELPITLTLLRLAEGCSLLAMDAEVVVDYGLAIKRRSLGEVLPVGYTNGMLGYVPTAEMLEEGGYEAVESTVYFAMPSVFSREVEPIMMQAINSLLCGYGQ